MIEFSIEILTHFRCVICKKWWTVRDWKKKQIMCCPHCGNLHYEFIEKVGLYDDEKCMFCGGNNKDAPCAYPCEKRQGCDALQKAHGIKPPDVADT